jgi:beta-lactamase regulating signal transducer with metallopeptidase domain
MISEGPLSIKRLFNLFCHLKNTFTMKIFIAFMLLLFTNCLAPMAISATVNVKTAVANSVISPAKKLNFKEKIFLKLSKKEGGKLSKFQIFLLIGVILIVAGIVLLIVANQRSKNANSFEGFGDTFIAGLSIGLGAISLIVGLITKNKKPK